MLNKNTGACILTPGPFAIVQILHPRCEILIHARIALNNQEISANRDYVIYITIISLVKYRKNE